MTKTETLLHPADPRHASYAGYQAGCRCDDCRVARRAYDRRRAYDQVLDRPRLVDATRARVHLDLCVRWGVRYRSFGTVQRNAPRIQRGDLTRIHASTERAILAVTPQPGVNCWSAFAATRRLRSLVALGHPQTLLADRTGLGQVHLSMLVNDSRNSRHFAPATWHAVDAVFRDLCMTPGHSTRSLRRAERYGWVPPLAFDNIDDPDEQPTPARYGRPRKTDVDEATVLRVLAGDVLPCTAAEKREITERWVRSGRPLKDLHEQMGWKVERYGKVSDLLAVAS